MGEIGNDQANLCRLAALPSDYVDSASANSSMLHRPTGVELQTRALSSLMDALNILQLDSAGPSRQESQEIQKEKTTTTVSTAIAMTNNDEDDDKVVEEWEALRDVVCQRWTGHSTSRLFAALSSHHTSGLSTPGWSNSRPPSPPPHEDIDGGRALQRIWRRWKQQIDSGELDLHL